MTQKLHISQTEVTTHILEEVINIQHEKIASKKHVEYLLKNIKHSVLTLFSVMSLSKSSAPRGL